MKQLGFQPELEVWTVWTRSGRSGHGLRCLEPGQKFRKFNPDHFPFFKNLYRTSASRVSLPWMEIGSPHQHAEQPHEGEGDGKMRGFETNVPVSMYEPSSVISKQDVVDSSVLNGHRTAHFDFFSIRNDLVSELEIGSGRSGNGLMCLEPTVWTVWTVWKRSDVSGTMPEVSEIQF